MNKHRSNWSVMGIEPKTELSSIQKLRLKHKESLKHMIKQYNKDGFQELADLLREIFETKQES